MKNRYWIGVALGLAVYGGLGYGARQWMTAVSAIPAAESLVFDPSLVSEIAPWMLPGQSREFTVQLYHRGRDVAVIEELRFSCPCATGTLDGQSRFPVSIAPGESLPVRVTVKSARGERGRVELRYGVIGRVGETVVRPGALAEFEFVQVLNADPPVVALGGYRRADGTKSATVSVWSPAELLPTSGLTIETLEPALSAVIEPALERSPPAAAPAHQNVRVPLGTLTITLDPQIAPERLKADVVVRAGTEELRIPVLGLLDTSSVLETASD